MEERECSTTRGDEAQASFLHGAPASAAGPSMAAGGSTAAAMVVGATLVPTQSLAARASPRPPRTPAAAAPTRILGAGPSMPNSTPFHPVQKNHGQMDYYGKEVRFGMDPEQLLNCNWNYTENHGLFKPTLGPGCSFQELIYGFTIGSLSARGDSSALLSSGPVEQTAAALPEGDSSAFSDGNKSNCNTLYDGYMQSGEDGLGSPELSTDNDEYGDEKHNNGLEGTLGDGRMSFPCADEMDQIDLEHFYSTGELVKQTDIDPLEKKEGDISSGEAPGTGPAQGWKKRRRVRDGGQRPDHRNPTGMGAIERAMRKYCEKRKEHMFEPVIGLSFDSEAEAVEFYNLYSWEVGFGMRKGNLHRNGSGYQTMRELVFQRQGLDRRAISKTKCCNCPAMIRLHRTDDDGWFISSFVKEHNHELSATDAQKREWNSHSKIDQSTRDMVKYLRENNITLSKVHIIMGSLFGSMDSIPFSRRSLRTICAQIAREQRADDIRKTMEIFRKMHAKDPGFQCSFELDEKEQIKTLMWTNGISRSNYSCFGDVVTFDTTYSTNLYKMPFGLFVGVNNHFQTTVFGGVLMRDEKAESFEWVFKEFILLMGGVKPKTILTDQCKAMEIAIKETMEGTEHLWCRWHVFKDARLELGPVYRKNSAFRDEFHKVITEMYTIDEFEAAWKDLLERYGLQDHHFLVKAYDKRHKWAKAYNKDKFCARMMSTQRSESANHMLKTVVPRNSSMNRFVDNLNKLLYTRYTEEEKAEHETNQDVRVKKRMWPVESHAMQIYTSKVYELFRDEIDKSHSYNVFPNSNFTEFMVKHNNAEYVQRYKRPEFKVKSLNKGQRYQCDCGMYEHFGMLCCHVLRVFIHMGVHQIPSYHIMQRWTRKARETIPMNLRTSYRSSNTEDTKLMGQSLLYGKALELARKGNQDIESLEIAMKYIQIAEKKIDKRIEERERNATNAVGNMKPASSIECVSSSDTESVSLNVYGASGSSAYMSDDDVMRIKAPPIPVRKGRPKTNRYLSLLDITKKKKKSVADIKQKSSKGTETSKKATKGKKVSVATKITPHCTKCRTKGHDRRRCEATMLA